MIRALFRGLKSLIRKLLKLGAVVGAVAFLVRLFTRRKPSHDTETVTSGASGELTTSAASTTVASTPSSAASAAGKVAAPQPGAEVAAAPPETAPETAVETATSESSAWVAPDAEGACPVSHPIKVKVSSGIYHVPGGIAYDRTAPDRCYVDAAAAEADGYRPSKR